jgi:hypothetical protein
MSDVKLLRKQIRNVLQEEGGSEAIKVAVEQCDKLITEKLAGVERMCIARLEEIHKGLNEQLTGIDKRSRAVQKFIVDEVVNKNQRELAFYQDTVDALIDKLMEAGVAGGPELKAQLEEHVLVIRQRKTDQAAGELKARLEAERAQAEQAAQAQTETPAVETSNGQEAAAQS